MPVAYNEHMQWVKEGIPAAVSTEFSGEVNALEREPGAAFSALSISANRSHHFPNECEAPNHGICTYQAFMVCIVNTVSYKCLIWEFSFKLKLLNLLCR